MIHIALIDDNALFIQSAFTVITNYFDSKKRTCSIKKYMNPQELVWDLDENMYFDIYFIDIEMPGMNGFELTQSIRCKYPNPFIIFVTSHLEYSLKGYEYNAFRYILKSQMEEKIPQALTYILNQLDQLTVRQYIIQTSSKLIRLNHNEILYLHVDKKYTYIYTLSDEYRERISLSNAYNKLNNPDFLYVDKSYIVNLYHVMSLVNHEIHMRNGSVLPVSLPQFRTVRNSICDYWSEKEWK